MATTVSAVRHESPEYTKTWCLLYVLFAKLVRNQVMHGFPVKTRDDVMLFLRVVEITFDSVLPALLSI
jgi:hypothetical protein